MATALLSMPAVAAVPSPTVALAPSGGGQQALAVGFDDKGQLRARACEKDPCSLDGSTPIAMPPEVASLASQSRLEVVHVGLDRKALVIEIPDPSAQRTWTTVVVAPLAGAPSIPALLFSGFVGLTGGIEGERSGPMVLVRSEGLYVGIQREGRDLCGRPAILAPEALDPATLGLKPAKVQRLTEAERAAATQIAAQPVDGALPPPPGLLRALWATSAAPGAPAAALTDGKVETSWEENRGGAGRGELVVLDSPREVAISGFELALPGRAAPHVAVPTELWLATRDRLFHVTVPADQSATPRRLAVPLPSPLKTSCVAVVLEKASSDDREATVGIAEVWARPAMAATLDDLIRTLSAGGADEDAAGAVLRAEGAPAFSAVAAAFPSLGENARRVALDVLDEAACDIALPAYIQALVGPFEAQRLHAQSALLRCRRSTAPAFAEALEHAPDPSTRGALAGELAQASPELAIRTLVPRLAGAGATERRAYREAIGQAARATDGHDAVDAALGDERLDPRASLDLMRALGNELPSHEPAASRAFARTASSDAPFRTRFLLLEPAAALAGSDGAARAFLRQGIGGDSSPFVRAQAARVVPEPGTFATELSRALDDPSVRVREAAVLALGRGHVTAALDRVTYLLKQDTWPLVRAAAARSLADMGPSRSVDDSLGGAVEDESAEVRRAALGALAKRGARGQAKRVRERLSDGEEAPSVRAAAARSLGALCDEQSVDLLTEHARHLASGDDAERAIGREALIALGMLKPNDLTRRLAPLEKRDVPAPVRALANAALGAPGQCGNRGPSR